MLGLGVKLRDLAGVGVRQGRERVGAWLRQQEKDAQNYCENCWLHSDRGLPQLFIHETAIVTTY